MGAITVEVGGRGYKLLCRDGEEDHLATLAGLIEAKANGLTAALGAMSEPRLLLMAGLQIADELVELRKGGGAAAPSADDARYAALLARVEAMADALDRP